MKYNLTGKRIFIAGHRGMVGRALIRRLQSEDCTVLTALREELDLTRQADVEDWFAQYKPDAVIMAAAKVGGILANQNAPVDFLLNNLLIETNTINAAFKSGVEKFLLLGSSCIYPKFAAQPISEDALLTGPLEPTNEAYAIAKIAGLKLCEAFRRQHGSDFISAMPCNLYGSHDNFDLETSHVIPALIRKIHEAKISGAPNVTLWGTGTPLREFLFVDDLADALVFILQNYSDASPLNVGSNVEVTIAALAQTIADVIGYQGNFSHDSTKPDGTPRKLLDSTRLQNLGWIPQTPLAVGIRQSYEWFKSQF
ncbi:MAG TPA: GDP-L-fucose synthase [Alphaproteobacteria bacterium]|nr:GDP-L-fucose synthase [Alphaproteobacteria bacterium]